ncbi:uncharacterized protein [Clytia hemisphaerica]|uniref:Uncharacterized protein n=1 Tax=Clytia hemisphaerica TaxID=252671 RepID=A0A7M5UTR9_9CNID|eukprot:TCONS_00053179-protein
MELVKSQSTAISHGKTLWKNATKSLLKTKKIQEGYTNLDMGSLSEVLLHSLQEEWERKTSFMKECPLFGQWLPRELKAVGATATVCEFPENNVIIKDLSKHEGIVYAIISGRCLVVSKIHVMRESPPYGQRKMRMISSARANEKRDLKKCEQKEIIFLVIRKLEKGDCFGFGEKLPDTSVISEKQVELLSIPTVQLIRHGSDRFLPDARTNEMTKYPTLKEAFMNYKTKQDWESYKEQIRDNILRKKYS